MGDPKKSRKKYSKPRHPWMKGRIEEERILKREFGFKNKRELWKVTSLLKDYLDRAKKNSASRNSQSDIEQKQLIDKLKGLDLIKGTESSLDTILGIGLRDLLERRLQSIVYKKKLARTVTQARQFIVHGHIEVAGKKITSPSYLVTVKEESQIKFVDSSALNNEDHPERVILKKKGEA